MIGRFVPKFRIADADLRKSGTVAGAWNCEGAAAREGGPESRRVVALLLQGRDEDLGGRKVRCEGNVVRIANLHERRDVWFVRMGGERVAQKDYGGDLAFGDLPADLQVSAKRPREHLFDGQADFRFEVPARGSGGDQVVGLERLLMVLAECDELILFFIVCDQCDFRHEILSGFG